MRFVVNPDRYAVDAIAGETIVMDMLEGHLFLFEAGAARVFNSLERGVDLEALLVAIEARYGESEAVAVREFVAGLVAKQILAPSPEEDSDPASSQETDWPSELGELSLTEYDDITSIITMDPIHDVDPRRGWPFDERT